MNNDTKIGILFASILLLIFTTIGTVNIYNKFNDRLNFYLTGRSKNIYRAGVRMYSVSEYIHQVNDYLRITAEKLEKIERGL